METEEKEIQIFQREMCGNCSYLDCDGKSFEKCFKEFKEELYNV